MYLFPCLAPHLHIEIFDTEHKGEHTLFANKKTNQKKNTSYPWYQNQAKIDFDNSVMDCYSIWLYSIWDPTCLFNLSYF